MLNMLCKLGAWIPVFLGLFSEKKKKSACVCMHAHRVEIKQINIWDNKFYLMSIFDLSTYHTENDHFLG